MQVANLKKTNEQLRERNEEYFKQVQLPMQIKLSDFEEAENKSKCFETGQVQ